MKTLNEILSQKVLKPIEEGKHNFIIEKYEIKTVNKGQLNELQYLQLNVILDENRPHTINLFNNQVQFLMNNLQDRYAELYEQDKTFAEALDYVIKEKLSSELWYKTSIKDGHIYKNIWWREPNEENIAI